MLGGFFVSILSFSPHKLVEHFGLPEFDPNEF